MLCSWFTAECTDRTMGTERNCEESVGLPPFSYVGTKMKIAYYYSEMFHALALQVGLQVRIYTGITSTNTSSLYSICVFKQCRWFWFFGTISLEPDSCIAAGKIETSPPIRHSLQSRIAVVTGSGDAGLAECANGLIGYGYVEAAEHRQLMHSVRRIARSDAAGRVTVMWTVIRPGPANSHARNVLCCSSHCVTVPVTVLFQGFRTVHH